MDLSLQTKTVVVDNREWLANDHYENESITLDLAAFTEADHYPGGIVTSGIYLGKITASGKYGPYDDGASDGTEVCTGILFGAKDATGGNDLGAAMLVHGFVIVAKLPTAGAMTNGGHDAAADADLPLILARS